MSATQSRPPASTKGHKRTLSVVSTDEVVSRSPAARRMSASLTRQSGSIPLLSSSPSFLDHPQFVIAGLASSAVLCGTIYSLVFHTSIDTSTTNIHYVERTAYFARKSNLFNQVFVKKAWGWTTAAFLAHWVSSPPSVTSRSKRLAAFLLATCAWLAFTTWFFGAGLGDRIISLSGGSCAVEIPTDWGLSASALSALADAQQLVDPNSNHASHAQVADESSVILSLPPAFCSAHLPFDAKTYPSFFDKLPDSIQSLKKVRTIPRWHKGHDISGHTFLLTLSAIVLARELGTSWRLLVRRPELSGQQVGRGGGVPNFLATIFGTALIGLWIVMLTATAIYFHVPSEKISGLALGLGTAALVNLLSPINTPSTSYTPTAAITIDSSSPPVDDENYARRGETEEEQISAPVLGAGEGKKRE